MSDFWDFVADGETFFGGSRKLVISKQAAATNKWNPEQSLPWQRVRWNELVFLEWMTPW